jgi:hypothetical protein
MIVIFVSQVDGRPHRWGTFDARRNFTVAVGFASMLIVFARRDKRIHNPVCFGSAKGIVPITHVLQSFVQKQGDL